MKKWARIVIMALIVIDAILFAANAVLVYQLMCAGSTRWLVSAINCVLLVFWCSIAIRILRKDGGNGTEHK